MLQGKLRLILHCRILSSHLEASSPKQKSKIWCSKVTWKNLKLEELSETKLVGNGIGGVVGDFTDKNVRAKLLDLHNKAIWDLSFHN